MSYILNALRKSERERQAVEPDTVTSRIAIHHSQPDKRSSKLIVALIVINVGILTYFLRFNSKTATVSMPTAGPLSESDHVSIEKPLPSVKESSSRKTENPTATSTDTTASPIARAVPVKPVKPVIAVPKPAEPVLAKTVKPVAALKEDPNKAAKAINVFTPVVKPAAAIQDTPEKSAPSLSKPDWPYLEQLPAEFSRSVPTLSINVFSYSSIPTERFVMIDMVKYVPGQRIKDQLELKEIREDSIVVNYEQRTFKIRRP